MEKGFRMLLYNTTLEIFCKYIQNKCFFRENKKKAFVDNDEFNDSLSELYLNAHQILGRDKTIQVSKEVGTKLFEILREKYPNEKTDTFQSVMDLVIRFFVDGQYIMSGEYILHDDKIANKYGILEKNQFFYIMHYPIIFSSAKTLFNDIDIAPHFSSRTIEAALRSIGYIAEFDSSFNINEFQNELVVEKWNYTTSI